MQHALVLAGGELGARPDPLRSEFSIAADSGLRHAETLGIKVDAVIGDFDSVDPAQLERARASGAEILGYPTAKDQTDLELALRYAIDQGAGSIDVVGLGKGRADHELANILLLGHKDFVGTEITGWTTNAKLMPVHTKRTFAGQVGSTLTLSAIGGDARGVTTTGLRWKLDNDELIAGSTRGVSNEFVEPVATVTVRSGTILVIQSDAPG